MHMRDFIPAPKGVAFRGSPVLMALLDEKREPARRNLTKGDYLRALLACEPKPRRPIKAKRPKTPYAYVILRVSRGNGKATTISLDRRFYDLHCEMLGASAVQATIKDAAKRSVLRVVGHTFSRRVRDELVKRTKAKLSHKELLVYRRKLRLLDKSRINRKPKTKTVPVPAATQSGVTRVSLSEVFYNRAKIILGKRSFSAWLKTASESYDLQSCKQRGFRGMYITGYISNMIDDLSPYL